MINKWAEEIHQETKRFWISKGSPEAGFATFYSPVREHPKFLVVGYNPGGDGSDFSEDFQLPKDHDYFAHDYKLARSMKTIFTEAGMIDDLKDSVKTNLIFFRSKKAGDIKDKEVKSFSQKKIAEIIEKVKPEYIIAEGFGTFDALIRVLGGKKERDVHSDGPTPICLASIGQTNEGVRVIGFRHPSGSRPNLSGDLLREMGRILKQLCA